QPARVGREGGRMGVDQPLHAERVALVGHVQALDREGGLDRAHEQRAAEARDETAASAARGAQREGSPRRTWTVTRPPSRRSSTATVSPGLWRSSALSRSSGRRIALPPTPRITSPSRYCWPRWATPCMPAAAAPEPSITASTATPSR